MDAAETAQAMTAFMKENGYKKRGLGWKKTIGDVSIAVTVQRSQWDKRTWYLCFGATVLSIIAEDGFQAANYPVRERLEGRKLTPDRIEYAVKLWEDKYGTVGKLAKAAVENRLPLGSDRRIIGGLTTGEFFIKAIQE